MIFHKLISGLKIKLLKKSERNLWGWTLIYLYKLRKNFIFLYCGVEYIYIYITVVSDKNKKIKLRCKRKSLIPPQTITKDYIFIYCISLIKNVFIIRIQLLKYVYILL